MLLTLIGYRGTGKTTVARLVALELGWPWVDADVEIELRAGKSIAAIFADEGEPAFRDLESQVIQELTAHDNLVIASGGGVVLRAENRAALSRGRVVWLTARPETILARLSTDPTTMARRPPLTTCGGTEEISQLLAQRTPLYQECANLQLQTDEASPSDLALQIVRWLDPVMKGS